MKNGHPTREEDFDLYVLGALEGDEKQAIESHLAACGECVRKLTAARGRVAAISFAAPRAEPSPAVRDRLLRQIRAEASAHAPAGAPARNFVPPEPPRSPFRWELAILTPALAALMLFTLYLWRENDRLTKQLAGLRVAMDATQKQLEYALKSAHLAEAKDTVTVSLAPMPTPGMPKGAAHVMYNPKMGMLMYDGWIDPPPQDKSYQLWVVPMDGKPISAGVFNPATSDQAHWMSKVPKDVAVKAFAVTLEPAGGMPEPTGPMVLTGT